MRRPLPTARLEAIRILLAFAASKGFKLRQMDVKSAFLNGGGGICETTSGFESARFLGRVYKLRKTLYGRSKLLELEFLLKSGFVMGSVDKTLFLLSRGGETTMIYVDDIIFGGSSHALVSSFAERMSKEFEMSLMGELRIKQGLEGTFVHQAKYTRDILKKFNMGDSKPMTTPMSTNTALDADEDGEAEFRGMIGSYVPNGDRADIRFADFSPSSGEAHFRVYEIHSELGLWYSSGSSLFLRGFSNADHLVCRIDRKSTFGTCQLLGTSLVSWSSRKQASVSLSTTKRLLWMKATLSDFGLRFGKIPLLVDSTSAISIAKNPVLHSRTKHIDVRFHF
ncbi:LOW QUALITY PROTEIN: hypothetical protein U9M48_043075 [Paspalum notatum var. saurae]|uniref:Reverse transcriptase Ty1/copia-type domain-containing protein n=1 Tax=Paspalum notatum var. saurae TaxID=547442 RepID=A0AAQ3UTX2_PASNO